MSWFIRNLYRIAYDPSNTVDVYDPEVWARESLELLNENMVMAGLVHRNFEDEIQEFGDVVNTRLPSAFEASRKGDNDDVTIQAASATNVPVVLNHHAHTSFVLKDGQMSRSFKDLVEEFLSPAVISVARYVDRCLSVQAYQFLSNPAGHLGMASASTIKSYILEARLAANNNLLSDDGNRNLVWTPESETAALDLELFTDASKTGDGGTALERGSLGRKFGFRNFMAQNQPNIINPATGTTGGTKALGAINGALGVGTTVLVVDGFTGDVVPAGSWIKIAGDDVPQHVTASSLTTGNTTGITITPGLVREVADNAVITIINPGAVNLSGGYAAAWYNPIAIDAFTVAPQVGQGVTFGTSTVIYGIIKASTTSITLDRPLDASIADNAAVNLLPAGSYNFGFDRGSIALINRPLALPDARMGSLAYVAKAYGLSIRVEMAREARKQGTLITIDTLCGFSKLNGARGIVMFG